MFRRDEVEGLLAQVREIGASNPLVDIHVHPFAVMGWTGYQPNPETPDLFSAGAFPYKSPSVEAIPGEGQADGSGHGDSLSSRFALFFHRKLYVHSGAEVFRAHMRLSGVGKVLLVPVAGPGEAMESQMEHLVRLFGEREDFVLGYCVPDSIEITSLRDHLAEAVRRYEIRAVKIHPNITGIDPESPGGRERLEGILDAAGANGLKVLIHTGPSPDAPNPEARDYGRLEKLMEIDWGRTRESVVIAHGGAFGLGEGEAEREIMPRLNRLLSRHDHLYADLSGVKFNVLRSMLLKTDHERLLFGSDALYRTQYAEVAKLFHALGANRKAHRSLIRIASINPRNFLGEDHEKPASAAAH